MKSWIGCGKANQTWPAAGRAADKVMCEQISVVLR
jgi:hypothetical protein